MADWPYNTATWQKLRASKLASCPLCHPCKLRGDLIEADTVDHIRPIADGGDPFPPLDGLMSMCARCHNEKTAANDRTYSKPFARKFKGFDASGNPVDPSDDWHSGGASNHENRSRSGPCAELGKYLVSSDLDDEGSTDQGFA
jgi:hypothetical protein